MIHVATMMRRWLFVRRPAGVGRDDGPHAHVLTRDSMILFRIKACIGHDTLHPGATPSIQQELLEVGLVRACAGRGTGREDQVATA